MASNSWKYICPFCYQIARSTDREASLVCGHCNLPMKYVPNRSQCSSLSPAPPEPDLDDLNRGLDD